MTTYNNRIDNRYVPTECEASIQCSWPAPNPGHGRIIVLLVEARTAPIGGPTAPANAETEPPIVSSWKSTNIRRRSCRLRRTSPRCPRPRHRVRHRNRIQRGRPGWRTATWPWPRTRA